MSNTNQDPITQCLNTIYSSNTSVCEPNCGNTPSKDSSPCVGCICQQCKRVGPNDSPDLKNCCQSISNLCAIRRAPEASPGCFDKCSDRMVDASSYDSEIIAKCCNNPGHSECCAEKCVYGSNIVSLSPFNQRRSLKLLAEAGGNPSPIDKFCAGVVRGGDKLTASNLQAIQADKPYCAQIQAKSKLDQIACKGYCGNSLSYESCVLSNADKIIADINATYTGRDKDDAKYDLDLMFCQHKNDGDNCRSCMICNYLKYVNPNLGTQVENYSLRSSPEGKYTVERYSQSSSLPSWVIFLIFGAGILILILVLTGLHKGLKKNLKIKK